jgi:nitrogen fixation/metabolism regulation signal transduction histidine kinase
MIRIRSFQSRVFAVLLVVALLPAAVVVAGAAFTLSEVGATVGTLGPWDAVAESGQTLADAAIRAAPEDSTLVAAAETHREALSESLRRSRLWSLVAGRVRTLLPLAAVITALLLGGLAFLAARWLSRSIARPIHELVGWTGLIARGEALPPEGQQGRAVREFRELQRSLRSMADELTDARRREVESARLRAWTEMARRVAHEIKNPLTPMRMAAATLGRSDDPQTADTAELMLQEIGRLDEMARTFSQFGRMPEGPKSEVDLVELAETVSRGHTSEELPVAVRAGVDVPMVIGHYELLSRALRNMLVNALEAVESVGAEALGDAPVEVEVHHDGDVVRVAVRDRGPGIPEEILDSVWMPDVTTKTRGTGLGLAMVRQAAEAHGGTTAIRNRPDGGTEVEITLPTSVNGS